MKNISHCRVRFLQGVRDRRENPFIDISAYKLRELARYPDKALANLAEMMGCVRRGERPFCLDEGYDVARYWKGVPGNLSYRLGKDGLPSIKALHLDGVPQHVLDAAYPEFDARVNGLVEELAYADHVLRVGGIKAEYERWRHGDSVLLGPCHAFKQIVTDGLALITEK